MTAGVKGLRWAVSAVTVALFLSWTSTASATYCGATNYKHCPPAVVYAIPTTIQVPQIVTDYVTVHDTVFDHIPDVETRTTFRTILEHRQVPITRTVFDCSFEPRTFTKMVPHYEIVPKPVTKFHVRFEHDVVMKTFHRVEYRCETVPVTRTVFDKQMVTKVVTVHVPHKRMVQKPVTRTRFHKVYEVKRVTRHRPVTECVPVTVTIPRKVVTMQPVTRTRYVKEYDTELVPVTRFRKVVDYVGGYEQQTVAVPAPGASSHHGLLSMFNACGLLSCFGSVPCQIVCQTVYVCKPIEHYFPETVMVPKTVCRIVPVPYTCVEPVCTIVPEPVTLMKPVTLFVPYECDVPVVKMVPECYTDIVTVCEVTMVPTQQVRSVPVCVPRQVTEMVTRKVPVHIPYTIPVPVLRKVCEPYTVVEPTKVVTCVPVTETRIVPVKTPRLVHDVVTKCVPVCIPETVTVPVMRKVPRVVERQIPVTRCVTVTVPNPFCPTPQL